MYRLRGWRDSFLNLQQMSIVMRPSCWHKSYGPNGLFAPYPRAMLNFFSSITTDFNISSALRWAIHQWSSGFIISCFNFWILSLVFSFLQYWVYIQCNHFSQNLESQKINWAATWQNQQSVAVRPAKTQISLGICPVWSQSSLCAQWVAKDPSFLHADSKDSDQTGRMPRLIWVFAGHTCILLVLSQGGSIPCGTLFSCI